MVEIPWCGGMVDDVAAGNRPAKLNHKAVKLVPVVEEGWLTGFWLSYGVDEMEWKEKDIWK